VYSFGVVMWEVAARKQPFAGCNFMAVAIEVLEGRRPKIPADLPPVFKKLIKRYFVCACVCVRACVRVLEPQ
jgi:hypothetical protein